MGALFYSITISFYMASFWSCWNGHWLHLWAGVGPDDLQRSFL